MDLREPSLETPVEQKMAWAIDFLGRWKQDLLRDEKLAEGLVALKRAIGRSRERMARIGIVDLCRACEEHEGGSCCGAGIEKHYSAILLLLNLLLDAKIPHSRHDPSSCFFLTKDGCQLFARHVLCVNFLCHKVTSLIPPEKIADLRKEEGTELELLFLLHERIKKKAQGSLR
jgi:hypothetical protein